MEHKKKKHVLLKELVVFALCVAAAFYLRSLLTFTPSVNQALWSFKVAAILYVAYHVLGLFVAFVKTLLGVMIFLVIVAVAGFFILGHLHPTVDERSAPVYSLDP